MVARRAQPPLTAELEEGATVPTLQMSGMNTLTMMLGELRGQVRELVHTVNNISMKVDGLSMQVAPLTELPATVAANKVKLDSLASDKDKRDGAKGAANWLIHSPLVGWLAAVGAIVWSNLHATGKI